LNNDYLTINCDSVKYFNYTLDKFYDNINNTLYIRVQVQLHRINVIMQTANITSTPVRNTSV